MANGERGAEFGAPSVGNPRTRKGHAQSKAMVKENAAVEVCSGTAVWYHTGLPVVPIRWVLVRDPQGKFKSQALLCTNQAYSPTQILEWFVRRTADGSYL